MLMKKGMATRRLYMSKDYNGMEIRSCVTVYLLEQVRLIIQYKRETIFRSELIRRIAEMTTSN